MEHSSSAGGDETDPLSRNSGARGGRGFFAMLVARIRFLSCKKKALVTLSLERMERPSGVQQQLINPPSHSDNPNRRPRSTRRNLLLPTRQVDPRPFIIRRMPKDHPDVLKKFLYPLLEKNDP